MNQLIITALLLLLLAGFALLEVARAGDKPNAAINTMLKASLGSAWVILMFALVGYGLMFGDNNSGFFGASHFLFTEIVNVPLIFYGVLLAVAMFITGSALPRIPYNAHITASVLLVLIFALIGSWVWNNSSDSSQGWLAAIGFIDIAGATVIHSSIAWMALAAIFALGGRSEKKDAEENAESVDKTDVRLLGFGVILVWLGWLGLSSGTLLFVVQDIASESALATALLNTVLAAVGGMIAASMAAYMVNQRLQITTMVQGSIGGLVSVSAGVAVMLPLFALFTSMVGGAIAVLTVLVLRDANINDSRGIISAHGFAGAWGTLAAGIFYSGDFFNPDRVLVQMLGILVVFVVVFSLSWLVYRLVRQLFGLSIMDIKAGKL